MIFPENCRGIFRVAHVGMKVLGYSYTLSQHGRLPDKVSSFQDIPTCLFHHMLTCGNIKCIWVANIYQAREVPPEKAVPTIAAMISEAEHQRRAVPPRGAFWHVGRVGHLPSSEALDPNDFVVLKYRIYHQRYGFKIFRRCILSWILALEAIPPPALRHFEFVTNLCRGLGRFRAFPTIWAETTVLDIYSTVPLKQAMVSSPLSVVTCHGINKSWGGRIHLPDPREEREILLFLLIPVVFAPFRRFSSNFFRTTVAAALVAKNQFFPAAKEAEKNAHLTCLSRASAAWIFIKIHQPRFGMKCWAGF